MSRSADSLLFQPEARPAGSTPGPGPGGTVVAGGVREGGDGDEICVDAEALFQFLDEQSRSLRDFVRFARGE